MNINTLKDYIDQFRSEIVESGFKRDLQDYVGSLPNNQNNIVVLREVANSILAKLDEIYNSDFPENMEMLLVKEIKSFTRETHKNNFQELLNDKGIMQPNFFQKLTQLLTQLNNGIQQNIVEIDRIDNFIEPYIDIQEEILTSEEKAIISIIFKDKKTTTELNTFIKNIENWNKTLPLYHQVLSSSSPEDIEIVNVQNGSINLLVNLNIDLAINLADIFEIGFKAFLAYLSYKKVIGPIVDSYGGNKKLIAGEASREKELINNIGEAVMHKISEQHKKALKNDDKIMKNVDKKIDVITKLVTSHILKGNDLKLLALPENSGTEKEDIKNNTKDQLEAISLQVKQAVKSLPQAEMKILLEKYKEPEENDEK